MKQGRLDGLKSIFMYTDVVRNIICGSKYKYIRDGIKDTLNTIPKTYILNYLKVYSGKNFFLTPIPLHTSRYHRRGFNQSSDIADFIARTIKIHLINDLLARIKNTNAQASLKAIDRSKNLQGAFQLNTNSSFFLNKKPEMMRIVLVDDVWTTGSTIKAAGEVLKKHSFQHVFALTLAR